jgi:outer membrane protein OmpA-like peptidoglycan-associated protein
MVSVKNFLAASLILASFHLGAQTDSIALSEQYYQMGMDIFDYQHRKQASEMFILAAQMNPKNAKAFFMAGQSIMLSLRKERSLPYYKKAYALDPAVSPDILFHLGQAYHYAELFDSAIMFYNHYNRVLSRTLSFDKVKKMNTVNRKIFECYNAQVMMASPVNVTITHLSDKINSEFPDYAPAIDAKETVMIFTTRRPEGNTNARVAQDHEYYEDIFISKNVNGEWTQAQNLAGPLNTNYHNASINLSPDGKEMLLYHDTNGGDIFAAFLKPDGSWSEPEELVGINSPYIENSATLTADGNTIYFTSSRPGGFGGTDIYRSVKDAKGKWSKPQNLGNLVNTDGDEDAVFISANGKHLYFSSNGHAGMGDLDVYRATFNEETKMWEKPINMGYPINSVENDIYFALTGDEGIAYFSSVRDQSFGEEDIYKLDISKWEPPPYTYPSYEEAVMQQASFTTLQTSTPEVKSTPKYIKINILVAEGSSRQPLEATVRIVSSKNEVHMLKQDKPGYYHIQLNVPEARSERFKLHVSNADYLPYTANYYFMGNALIDQVVTDTIYLDKISVNYNRILNVYFDSDSAIPKSFEDIHYLEQLLKTSSTLKVEISGHSDNRGDPTYNLLLSKKRSEAEKKYLVASGIDASRISVAGYGSEKPIADNTTREGRQLNRRTEFTILEK